MWIFLELKRDKKKKKKKRKKVKQPTSQRMRSSNWQEWSMKKSRLCGQNTPWWRDLHLSSCLQKIFCGRWTSIRNKCWQLPFLYEVWLLYIWFSCVVFCVFTLLVLSVEQPRQDWLACNATICVDKGFGFSRLFPWKVSGFQKNTQFYSIGLMVAGLMVAKCLICFWWWFEGDHCKWPMLSLMTLGREPSWRCEVFFEKSHHYLATTWLDNPFF